MALSDPFLSLRAPQIARSALWSAGLVILWLAAQMAIDHCWLYLLGIGSVTTMAAFGFAWLWLLLMLTWRGRIAFIALTLLMFALILPSERMRIAAVESRAASVLRSSAQRLEEEVPDRYPASGNSAIFGSDLPQRFYRFEYVPQYSGDHGKTNGFLLKARPLRYDCGCTASFATSTNGKVHMTKEDREATLNDPTLD